MSGKDVQDNPEPDPKRSENVKRRHTRNEKTPTPKAQKNGGKNYRSVTRKSVTHVYASRFIYVKLNLPH